MILVENKMLTTSLWRSEHLILNKDLSAGSDLRWWPSELTNERAPAGGPGTPRIIVPTIRVLLQYPSFREMLSTPVAG